jgi:hypothetical protein
MFQNSSMERFEINLTIYKKPSDMQMKQLREYFSEMPVEEILSGLNFARNRWTAKDAGVLKVGRKSIINKEIHSVTSEQAQWRLKNWKMMIANYRKLGYSYPTISRIKKHFIELSTKKSR